MHFVNTSIVSLSPGTYFSENALLPGLVQGDFQGDSQAWQYLEVGFVLIYRML